MSHIETACRFCIFKQDVEGQQVGCTSGALQKLQRMGHTMSVDDTGHYVLENTTCYYWRPETWEHAQGTEDLATLKLLAREEIRLKADIIVFIQHYHTLDDVIKTTAAIEQMTLLPKRLFFINNRAIKPGQFIHWANHNVKLPWFMELVIEPDEIPSLMSLVAKKCKSLYFSFFEAGYVPPPNFLADIDSALYDEMERFIVLTPTVGFNGLTYMRIIHQHFNNLEIEKVIKVCEEQNSQHLVRPASSIVKNLCVVPQESE